MNIDLDHFETLEELERDLMSWIKEEDIYSFDRYLNKEDVLKIVQMLIRSNLEIERLNKLISQREKKWEKWTTEKTILSTKMSDYLCKYQNIKREYTKQIKISTDRKKEIERLNNIIKEVREYIESYMPNYDFDKTNLLKILEILDKGE